MKYMGLAYVILGINIFKTSKGLILLQSHYIESMLRKYNVFYGLGQKFPVDLSLHLEEK